MPYGDTGMLSIRRALNASCVAAPQTCVKHNFSPRQHFDGLQGDAQRDVVALYARSVFCLMPIGDACVRIGVVDSLLLGCIPVVFHECQLGQMPWHAGLWLARASVFIRAADVLSGAVDPVAKLASISPAEVWRMQRVIAEHAHCVHYRRAVADGGDATRTDGTLGSVADAFDITLEAVLAVARGRHVAGQLCRRVPWRPASRREGARGPT